MADAKRKDEAVKINCAGSINGSEKLHRTVFEGADFIFTARTITPYIRRVIAIALFQGKNILRATDEFHGPVIINLFLPQTVNVKGAARHKMLQSFAGLSRAYQTA